MRMLIVALLALLMGACSQPRTAEEQPKPNGAYLVIDGDQAFAVLIIDGRRYEETGRMIESIRFPEGRHIQVSYLVEMPNCGRLQWLRTETGNAQSWMVEPADAEVSCSISSALARSWTMLDYSG